MAELPQVLIIVSADYGEMATALYLLDGTAGDFHLLLPGRLYEANRQALPVPGSAYANLDDLLAAIEQHKPKLVLLFSGYLFGVNQLLSAAHLDTLVRTARRLGARVATTDPFLGLLRHLDDDTFIHPQKAQITAHFAAVERVLEAVPHVYVSPFPTDVPASATAFYNPRLVLPAAARTARPLLEAAAIDPGRRHWLMILSLEDYIAQCSLHTRTRCDEIILSLLDQAAAQGVCPILLAPPPALDSLLPRASASARILGFMNHRLFRALLLEAEHVFYWNILSNSILARVANGGPVFFFDEGHLVRSIPSLVPRAMQSYYAGASLPMLDATAPLQADDLARGAAAQGQLFAPALGAFRQLPTPAAMLTALLAEVTP